MFCKKGNKSRIQNQVLVSPCVKQTSSAVLHPHRRGGEVGTGSKIADRKHGGGVNFYQSRKVFITVGSPLLQHLKCLLGIECGMVHFKSQRKMNEWMDE